MASDSVATILCTSKQTRFHIESPNYRELEIDAVSITVTSGDKATDTGKPSSKSAKGKSKAKAQGIEILSGAKLKLKEGQRYALVGRNGTGKSSKINCHYLAVRNHSC
jgi:ABC-type multidrug transport system ATPase subunit